MLLLISDSSIYCLLIYHTLIFIHVMNIFVVKFTELILLAQDFYSRFYRTVKCVVRILHCYISQGLHNVMLIISIVSDWTFKISWHTVNISIVFEISLLEILKFNCVFFSEMSWISLWNLLVLVKEQWCWQQICTSHLPG